jgi:hypothetical protein
MSETVAIALITAFAGFSGALSGAVAAVIGPWWLRRSDRVATSAAEARELRRLALVEWVDAELAYLAGQTDDVAERAEPAARFHRATMVIASRLTPDEEPVLDWLAGLASASDELDSNSGRSMLSVGTQMIFQWHRGTLPVEKLVPFHLVSRADNRVRITRGSWRDLPTVAE